MEDNYQWFPDLDKVVPLMVSTGEKVSLYTIALEGWRRGLSLKFQGVNKGSKLELSFTLGYLGREHKFEVSKGDKVSQEAIDVCNNKGLTKEYLLKAGVPVPKGKSFSADASNEEIIMYANELGFPLVIKPVDGSSGKGVITNITNKRLLIEALMSVRQKQKKSAVIVEQYFTGDEYRIYIIDGQVVGAVNRIPANIIGDGVSTITQLITEKNKARKKVPHLYNRPIKIDKEVINIVQQHGYTLHSVPNKNEQLFLRKISNISAGGDPVDVTDDLTPEIKKIAIDAVKAVPGLNQCGVDMIVSSDRKSGVIIELNTKAGIGSHLFPIKGKARDVPKAIIDYYFPEVKGVNVQASKHYFNFKNIVEPLYLGDVSEVEVTPISFTSIKAKLFHIKGNQSGFPYRAVIKNYAQSQMLNGYIKGIGEDRFEVLISGANEIDIEEFKVYITKMKEKLEILSEIEWKDPVKMGFESWEENRNKTLYEIESELEKKTKDFNQLIKDKKYFERQNKMIQKSNSWKLTKFLR